MKTIKTQEYEVEYETGAPVTLTVSVVHDDQTRLTDEEIILEAEGYLKDAGIDPKQFGRPSIITSNIEF